MKKFIINIAFFILLVVCAFLCCEIIFREFIKYDIDEHIEASILNFEEKSNKINYIFLGDSEVYYGIDPKYIQLENAHNFSFPSEPIQTTYWKVKYYFEQKKLKNLKTVFLLFEKRMINDINRIGLRTILDYSKYYNYYFDDIISQMHLRDKFHFWLELNFDIIRLKPSYKKKVTQGLENLNKNIYSEVLEKTGYSMRDYALKVDIFENMKSEQIIERKRTINTPENDSPLKYYRKLIELFETNNVKIIFFNMPDISILLNDIDELQIKGIFDEVIAKEYFPKIPFINCRVKPELWELNDFSDGDHLNAKGAKKIAEVFNKEIKTRLPIK